MINYSTFSNRSSEVAGVTGVQTIVSTILYMMLKLLSELLSEAKTPATPELLKVELAKLKLIMYN